ncbi:hypothetical protein [Granulicatella seriolae]|uniref:XRE family transcriptional regulator n=1 Tax=Granulicatella seriolae TaxID=2967226 RepID=A0ABT1WPT1_9LACT|nr:hypothetical protein [Granulicatella seriolae]
MIIRVKDIESVLNSGITMYKLAQEIGVPETAMSHYKRTGKIENMTIARASMLMEYAEKIGIEPDNTQVIDTDKLYQFIKEEGSKIATARKVGLADYTLKVYTQKNAELENMRLRVALKVMDYINSR